jgi:hypothetical protein
MADSKWLPRPWSAGNAAANSIGFATTARDLARFGLLILANGSWNGTDLLHNPGYLARMLKPSQDLNPSYGLLWWLNGQSRVQLTAATEAKPGSLIPSAPADLVVAQGALDRKCYVVPSLRLVVTRIGDQTGETFNEEFWRLLMRQRRNADPAASGRKRHGHGQRVLQRRRHHVPRIQPHFLAFRRQHRAGASNPRADRGALAAADNPADDRACTGADATLLHIVFRARFRFARDQRGANRVALLVEDEAREPERHLSFALDASGFFGRRDGADDGRAGRNGREAFDVDRASERASDRVFNLARVRRDGSRKFDAQRST